MSASLARLSRLQREILALAMQARHGIPGDRIRREPHGWDEVDVFPAEILVHCFEFPLRRGRRLADLRLYQQAFDRSMVGHARYNAAMASMSRAVRRLEERGLVIRYTNMTGQWGLRLADETVNTFTHENSLNRVGCSS